MGAVFNTLKWFVFGLNFICLLVGISVLCVNVLGLQDSAPGTDGHTFFVVGILLCGLLGLTTIIGCYGISSEVFGINVIYSIFLLSILIIQYLQIRSFQPHGIYFNTLQKLETAWRLVGTAPTAMNELQIRYYCCGLFNGHDYGFKHMTIPKSCYNENTQNEQTHQRGCLDSLWRSYVFVTHRQELFHWSLLIIEFITFFYSIILNILLFRRRNRRRGNVNDIRVVEPRQLFIPQNHIGSRQHLLSN